MMRIVCFIPVMVMIAGVAVADPYWIAYEGNDFPENEGWERYATDPPAQRWLEDGSLFIDSRGDLGITEVYGMYPDQCLNLQPGELLLARWRLRVHEAAPWEDPGVALTSDDSYAVTFIFSETYVLSAYEANAWAPFDPGVFHDFELRSADMRSYELYIDNRLAMEGAFSESLFPPGIGWGDLVRGGASLAEWDYFRFGVVPEPRSAILLCLGLLAWRNSR